MQKLTFITGNAKKAETLAQYFHVEVDHMKLNLPEIQSLNLEEVAIDKAQRAYEIVQSPVLVEDISLTFDAWNGLPGPLIKWFLHSIGNLGMCRMLDVFETREASVGVCYAYHDGTTVHTFSATRRGSIIENPQGDIGFGFDPIFVPEGHTKTWGEMDKEESDTTSIRKPALEKFAKFLQSQVVAKAQQAKVYSNYMDTNNTTNTQARVDIYSTSSCHFCHMAKEWLTEKGIAYNDFNVGVDADKRKEMVEMTGQLGVPVIKIGEDVMIGFNPDKMAQLLGVAA